VREKYATSSYGGLREACLVMQESYRNSCFRIFASSRTPCVSAFDIFSLVHELHGH